MLLFDHMKKLLATKSTQPRFCAFCLDGFTPCAFCEKGQTYCSPKCEAEAKKESAEAAKLSKRPETVAAPEK